MTEPAHTVTLTWRDAHGQPWTITADNSVVTLATEGSATAIPAAQWDNAIDYNDVGHHTVFRFDTGERQVGFMVPNEQAAQLLDTLCWRNTAAIEQAQRLRAQFDRPQTWPTMSTVALAALFGGAACSIPVVGLGAVIPTILAMAVARRRAAADPRLGHTGLVLIAGAVLLLIGIAAQVLAKLALDGAPYASPEPYAETPDGPIRYVIPLIVILLSLSVHEAAHAVAAWWCGDEGPLARGRVTLNPLAHIDPLGTVLVPAFLAYTGSPIFGWAKPVMVSLHNVPRPRRANLLISAAGPASNLILALAAYAVLLGGAATLRLTAPDAIVSNLTMPFDPVIVRNVAGAALLGGIATLVKLTFLINIYLFFFNMLPLPPLDGSHVLRSLLPRSYGNWVYGLGGASLIPLLVCLYFGLFQYLLLPASMVVGLGLAAVTGVTHY